MTIYLFQALAQRSLPKSGGTKQPISLPSLWFGLFLVLGYLLAIPPVSWAGSPLPGFECVTTPRNECLECCDREKKDCLDFTRIWFANCKVLELFIKQNSIDEENRRFKNINAFCHGKRNRTERTNCKKQNRQVHTNTIANITDRWRAGIRHCGQNFRRDRDWCFEQFNV